MKAVFKYQLDMVGENVVEIPEGWKALHVGMQHGRPCLWAQVNTDFPTRRCLILVVPTGLELPDQCDAVRFLGTAQTNDSLVWHVFDGGRALPQPATQEKP